jgi:hypothetical protein
MKFTDYILTRTVWFSSLCKTDYLAHKVARDLINYRANGDSDGIANLLNIVRRYE